MTLPSNLPAFFGFGTTIAALALTLGLLLPVVHAHPVWHDFNSRSSIDSFITGSTSLLAGGVKFGVPYCLTTPLPPGTSVIATTPRVTHHLTRGYRLDRQPYYIFPIKLGRRPVIFRAQWATPPSHE